MIDSGNREAVAGAFVAARRGRFALENYPGLPPEGLVDAYAIQEAALRLWDEPVGGWKVGRINAPLDARFGANRLAGPVRASHIVEAGTGVTEMLAIVGGFIAGEAEFMVRLAPPGPHAALPGDDVATLGWIDAVRIGIEIAASPYRRINADGPCVTVSDHGNNLGLVLGAAVPEASWSALPTIAIDAFVDGDRVASADASEMLDGPLGAVRYLLGHFADRGMAPRAGWWISTGAVTGVHELAPGQTFSAAFQGIGEIACRVDI